MLMLFPCTCCGFESPDSLSLPIHLLAQSYFGAKVLHPRTALPVMRYGIPMFIRNALNPTAPGTRIGQSEDGMSDEEEGMPEAARDEDEVVEEAAAMFQPVKAVATIDKVAIVNVEG